MLDEDSRVFDHNFFNISPKEAESTDPQHRVLLETVYEGIESAGYSIQSLKGSATAVFVGQMTADYYDVLARDYDTIPQYMSTGTSRCLTSNKISYFFDWNGPSVTIDTACSSSLVAVHQAVQELRHGQSTLAIAAGVNLILGPENYIHESKVCTSGTLEAHLFLQRQRREVLSLNSRNTIIADVTYSYTCFHPLVVRECGTLKLMATPAEKVQQPWYSSYSPRPLLTGTTSSASFARQA